MKKILIFFLAFFSFSNLYAYNLWFEEKKAVNTVIQIFESDIQKKWEVYKNFLIWVLNSQKQNLQQSTKEYEIINSVISWITKEDKKDIWPKLNNNISNIVLSPDMTNEKINNLLIDNRELISSNDNIFIFRKDDNISLQQMTYTTKKIYELNPHIRIFVDQEWWLVNRYNIFDKTNTLDSYLREDETLKKKYDKLEDRTKNSITSALKWRTTFFSAKKAWEIYNKLESVSEKKEFLDFISYFQLYSTVKAWINTYWLILDLDYWNPAISWNQRTFTKNKDDMILYWNYFASNAKDLWINLYLKHYPWHWAWKIDTHSWILEYTTNNNEYLQDNIWVFESVIKTWKDFWVNVWLMIGHIVLPLEYKNRFLWNLWEVDFILTDDLWMWAYKITKDKEYNDKFFTTKELLNYWNVIEVSTTINRIK